jgi:hypothetical protein
MKTESSSQSTLKRILLYVLAYLLWLVSIAVCIVAVIQLRSAVNVLWPALGGNRYSLSLVNQLVLLLGGLAAFIYVVFLEGYYRESVTHKAPRTSSADASLQAPASWQSRLSRRLTGAGLYVLLRRFVLATAIPLAVLALSFVLLEVALRLLP